MGKIVKGAIIAAVVTFAVVYTGGAAFGMFGVAAGTATAATVAMNYALLSFGGSLAMGGLAALTSKGIDASRDNFGSKVSGRSASQARQIIYGECRVGGTITQMQTTGTDNTKLCMFIVLSGHVINKLLRVRFNDTLLTAGTITSGTTVHVATNSAYTSGDNDNAFANDRLIRFTFHDGTQTVHDALARTTLGSSFVPDTHKFISCAYVYMEIVYDAEKLNSIPQISFDVQGKKVFDPRDDSTAYSTNPALCIRDYLTDTVYGIRAEASEINDTTAGGGFASAAATCAATVTLADSSTQPTYVASGLTNFSASGEGVLEALLSSCGGNMSYTNGKFNLFVAASQTPSLTVTDDDLLEPVSIRTSPPQGNVYNSVKTIFVDSTQSFKATDTPVFESSTFLNADTPSGEGTANYKKMLEIQLPFTVTHTAAQRLGRIALNQSRYTISATVMVGLNFLKAQPKDWVYVTNSRMGWSQKTFQILSMQLTPIGGSETPLLAVRLDLTETHADIYGFLSNAYGTPLAAATDLGLAHIKNIGSGNLIDASITTAKVVDGAVTTGKITDANVTTGKLADGASTTAKIGANAVTVPSSVYTAGTVTRGVNAAVLSIASIQFTVGATANIVLHLYFVPECNDVDATLTDFTYILKRGSTTIQTQSLTIHHNSEEGSGGNIVPSSTPFISGTFVDASVGAGNYTYTLSIGGSLLGASKRAFAATAAMK